MSALFFFNLYLQYPQSLSLHNLTTIVNAQTDEPYDLPCGIGQHELMPTGNRIQMSIFQEVTDQFMAM